MVSWELWLILSVMLLVGAWFQVGLFLKNFSVAAFICSASSLVQLDLYWQLRLFLFISLASILLFRKGENTSG